VLHCLLYFFLSHCYSHIPHRRSQDFVCGGALFLDQNLITFFCHYPLLRGHIHHILPPTAFFSPLRGCTSPNSARFPPHFKKCLEKNFSSPWGCTCTPLATPMIFRVLLLVIKRYACYVSIFNKYSTTQLHSTTLQ